MPGKAGGTYAAVPYPEAGDTSPARTTGTEMLALEQVGKRSWAQAGQEIQMPTQYIPCGPTNVPWPQSREIKYCS